MAGGVSGQQGPGEARADARVVPIGAARSAVATLRHAASPHPDAEPGALLLEELNGLISPEGALRERLDRREVLLHLLERQRTRRRHRTG